jgi:CRP-like cAMP-binding protein
MSDIVQALLETPLGSVLSSAEAADLAQLARQRSIGRGQYLCRIGDPSEALYIIINGALDVVLGQDQAGQVVVASLGPGQIVGELEAMTSSLRMASLLATEETQLLEISTAKFDEMLKANRPAANKVVLSIAKALARRLAAVNQRVLNKATPPPPPTPQQDKKPETVDDGDLVLIEDDDLDLLDRVWGSPAKP